eukprot:gnl/TRDRNA2_/TRDRNA2_154643_c4_seq2.p1 gnl/TRDRNA2_/TRDRNA2_154643_c4~~gnl/TRDRNA2_/TRDRNA2_154643_c4_seq2.p1  ORF type:complete len:208 (-),score=27.05 gnl/TRDRNA2_/TRDRNA2_154643_c4_seq2:250-873(-)
MQGSMLIFIGSFAYSAVEVASSLILELKFDWEPEGIGYALGCSFAIAALIVVLVSLILEKYVSNTMTVAALSIVGFLGAFLFLDAFSVYPSLVLLGDCMIYPCLLVIMSILEGSVYIASKEGTWYSMENLVVALFVCDSLGKFTSLPFTRGIVEELGQDFFSCIQMGLMVLLAVPTYSVLKGLAKLSPETNKQSLESVDEATRIREG